MFTEDQDFALLKRRIFLDRGLDCGQYKENYLKRRVAVRLRATEARDYLQYLHILRNNPREYTLLLNELTINVTQFFRDKDVYGKMLDHVIPGVVEVKRSISSRSIRVWSAGCASGEEPYSMAILVEEALGDETDAWNVRVLGSDIDDGSLEIAREGRYTGVEPFDGLEAEKYFDIEDTRDGKVFKVREHLKRLVKFEKMNLLEKRAGRHFDMVLCRNVLIYFSRDVQTRIIESLAADILRDGYLILGKSETLGREAAQLFKATFPRERIYQVVAGDRFAAARGVKNE